MNVVIADCVDEAVFALLNAIDQGVLRLNFVSSAGKVVDLENQGMGELGGWYAGTADGWRKTYAREAFYDDAGDLSDE